MKWAFKKRYAFFGFGILSSFIKDIEQAQVKKVLEEDSNTPEESILNRRQVYRLVIRPNIYINLNESLYLRSDLYWQFPYNFKGMSDRRIIWQNRLIFKPPSTYNWAKKVYLSLEYQLHKCNAFVDDDGVRYQYAKNKYSELVFKINASF